MDNQTQPALENTQPSDSQPTEPTVESLSGYKEGTVLSSGEIVKASYNDEGKLIGWHKENAPAKGEV